ncbi:N-terminal C2 in EEIG1 and EHBP1 proteins-domain-containing protein [Limtongia smithiae]|uniref:N-terminal C2 in EEIG1 and EHBP1 proteins-domain-containing protein n=1 Tax=Limtongia smithiae TaxID=1125753 RepID=UPI0034D005A9
MNTLIPKSRRAKFTVDITIHDLANIPLVSGLVFVRWHVRDSTRGDARGRTEKVPIKDHKAVWDYARTIAKVRMVIDRSGMLAERGIMFEILSEHAAGEKVEIGMLELNLAAYAKEQPAVARRYLLQHSKVNSTIKITISCLQLSGDATFSTPPLTSGQAFGGITGVLADHNQPDSIPTALSSLSSSMPSLYRKTLTASWQRQEGELPVEDCIEDIFAGGTGWAKDGSSVGSAGSSRGGGPTTHHAVIPAGTVTGAGVDARKRNGEIRSWAERDDLRSWVVSSGRV